MLSPVLPDEIALANIPRQRWKSVLEIVAFTEVSLPKQYVTQSKHIS